MAAGGECWARGGVGEGLVEGVGGGGVSWRMVCEGGCGGGERRVVLLFH